MIIDELKDKGIDSIEKVIDYLSLNQNGLYFLPNNLAELVAEIAHSSSPKSCINLNSNIGEILSKCTGIEYRLGIDVNAQNVDLSRYLNSDLNFENLNPLEYITNKKFDLVICCPPFGQLTEIKGRKIQSEKLYISKALELLNDNGKAILILPNNVLTAKVFEDTRHNILNKFGLEQIISLPQGVLRYTGVKLSIIVISNKTSPKTIFSKIENRNFAKPDFLKHVPSFSVAKDNLAERWDFNFHNPKNKEYERKLKNFHTERLENLVDVFPGANFSRDEIKNKGEYLWLTIGNISNGKLQLSENDKYITKKELNRREQNAILKSGDILIPITPRNKEPFYVHSETEQKFIAFQHFSILRGNNAEYVATYLNTKKGIDLFNDQIMRHVKGVAQGIISMGDLRIIEIPILPIEDLQLASRRKLEKLSYEELIKINIKYIKLTAEYKKLKEKDKSSAHEAQLESMNDLLNQVIISQRVITRKLDDIQSTLLNDFKLIKNLPHDIEDKINRLNENIDRKLEDLLADHKQLDFYISEIKRWFDFYDILELKSKKYLPEAEYIFDQISKLENPDYSPFILQYCRALENELLKKIFRAYVKSLIDRNLNIDTTFAWDLRCKESGEPINYKTSRLTKYLKRCLRKPEEEWFFELGSMEVNLRYLTGRTAEKSPVLRDFKSFVLNRFKQDILSIEYLDVIKTIINDYRNQSAHPNLIDTDKAKKFRKQMKECLICLFENYIYKH